MRADLTRFLVWQRREVCCLRAVRRLWSVDSCLVFNVTGGEVLLILVVALVVLGPEKLPDMIRKAARVYGEVRRMANGFQSEFKDAFEAPLQEFRDTVEMAKSSASGEPKAPEFDAYVPDLGSPPEIATEAPPVVSGSWDAPKADERSNPWAGMS